MCDVRAHDGKLHDDVHVHVALPRDVLPYARDDSHERKTHGESAYDALYDDSHDGDDSYGVHDV